MRESSRGGGSRATAVLELAAALAVALGSVFLLMDVLLTHTGFGWVPFAGVLGAFALAYHSGRYRDTRFLSVWVAAGALLAVVSTVTGFFNGLTDEPYGTPAFVQLLPNLYGPALHLTYYQYGSGPLTLDSGYIYLPLMTFLQVPGIDYRWVTVGAWAAMVFLLRRNAAAVLLVGGPWVALLAANGFNDFVSLVFLTVFFATLRGWTGRAAEVVSLGLKQFANVVVVVYYLWHRRWREALLVVGITVAFLMPFAFLDPSGVLCRAILLDPDPTCSSGNSAAFASIVFTHLNYYVWPLWLLAVFGPPYVVKMRGPAYATERALLARDLGHVAADGAPAEIPTWAYLLLPVYRLRTRGRRNVG